MKKTGYLTVCLILTAMLLCACTEAKPHVKDGQIKTAADLKILQEAPGGVYTLAADIDLGGAEWTPVEEFTGTLTGVWGGTTNHTIRNFTVKAGSEEEATGFFRRLTGTLANVNFAEVTVLLPEGYAGKAGGVAGICTGNLDHVKISGITVTGGCNGTFGALAGVCTGQVLNGYADGTVALTGENARVGGMVGEANDLTSCEARTDITFRGAGSLVGGLAGEAKTMAKVRCGGRLTVENSGGENTVAASLAGQIHNKLLTGYNNTRALNTSGNVTVGEYKGQGDGTVEECVTRDTADPEGEIPENEAALRRKVTDYMYLECTIPWSPSSDLDYADACASRHIQHYAAGEWYFGLPYMHHCGSLEKMQAFLTDGILDTQVVPKARFMELGNDCSDAVFWALQQVSVSHCFTVTDGMICENGMIPVGTYQVKRNASCQNSTKETCEANGEQVMYQAYSRMRPGDVMVKGPGGHTWMAAECAYVYRNPDGTVNGEKSYIVTYEQGVYLGDNQQTNHSTCQVGARRTFAKLFADSYVPVTVPEFAAGEAGRLEVSMSRELRSVSDLQKITLGSNTRIRSVQITVEQGDRTVADRTDYPLNNNTYSTRYDLSMLGIRKELEALSPGNYRVTIRVNGETTAQADVTKE